MLEKISQMAETAATSVSRRRFLGRLGAGAMHLAGAVAGVLAASSIAEGGRPVQVCSDQILLAILAPEEAGGGGQNGGRSQC